MVPMGFGGPGALGFWESRPCWGVDGVLGVDIIHQLWNLINCNAS